VKTEIKKLEGTKRELSIEVTGDIVKNKHAEVMAKIAKEATLPGFRAGHAPLDMVEKNFSSQAHEQVLKELIPEIYNQAIEAEKLDVIELPEIFDVKLEKESLSFKAKVEVAPEIELKNYKKLKIAYKKIEVSADEVKRSLDTVKESRKLDKLDDNFAKGLGYASLTELEKAFERQLFIQKENTQRAKIEHEIIQQLTKDLQFTVPQSLVNRQLQDLVRQTKLDLALKGYPKDKIEQEEANMIKELEPQAREQVKVYLVLAEIAKKENLPQDEHLSAHVMEYLLKEADWQETA